MTIEKADNEARLVRIRRVIRAARLELPIAIAAFETWRPMVEDGSLINRVNNLNVTETFLAIRGLLWRELIMAIMRFWDDDSKTIGLPYVIAWLREDGAKELLASDVASAAVEQMNLTVDEKNSFVENLIGVYDYVDQCVAAYEKGGAYYQIYDNFRRIRHQRLAHRQIKPNTGGQTDSTRPELEQFYRDTLNIVKILNASLNQEEFDLEGIRYSAKCKSVNFWGSVAWQKGEHDHPFPD
ncbi:MULTISPECIES: AbiU2 domain-containing protein [Herbaspirillum]|uniref:HEPN AbiU2-like domain-containing protein n=1 Tax=Herbaspirillum rubrisubalbicans Os34 TaxID=1235827 RepID=A0A6M3ZTV3_9BURK|nr:MULTISPECIES: hypothetical protein [Herbaspirillum]QJQ01976.1 hypothetical protein C798_17570 [Herbaspirillum rubrisubalbicans Os34]